MKAASASAASSGVSEGMKIESVINGERNDGISESSGEKWRNGVWRSVAGRHVGNWRWRVINDISLVINRPAAKAAIGVMA